jgi:hypothetical protein
MSIEDRLLAFGLQLPEPLQLPSGVKLPFPWIRVRGSRALIPSSSHTSASVTPGSFALRSACRLNSALYLFRLAMTHPQRIIALS